MRIMLVWIKSVVKAIYTLALIIRYPPIMGITKFQVANSKQVLFCAGTAKIPIRKMRIGIPANVEVGEETIRLSPVKDTPHYEFARNRLFGELAENRERYETFAEWLSWSKRKINADVGLTHSDYIRNFERLIDRISSKGYFSQESPIIVYPRIWKNDYVILDGAHRTSILAAMNEEKIECRVFIWKTTGPPVIFRL